MDSTETAVLNTAEAMLPALLAAITSGMAATTPEAAVIAMVAEVLPPLIQSLGANSAQIQQLMSALAVQIKANQNVIDQAAEARGIPVEPSAPAA